MRIIKNQFGRRNLSDYQRGALALQMKPIIEARALASYQANVGRPNKSSPNSDAINDIFTGEPLPQTAPRESIRTDTEVAALANLGKDTIRKIEALSSPTTTASSELLQAVRTGEVTINLASQFVALPWWCAWPICATLQTFKPQPHDSNIQT